MPKDKPRKGEAFRNLLERLDVALEEEATRARPRAPAPEAGPAGESPRPSPPSLHFPEAAPALAGGFDMQRLPPAPPRRRLLSMAAAAALVMAGAGALVWLGTGQQAPPVRTSPAGAVAAPAGVAAAGPPSPPQAAKPAPPPPVRIIETRPVPPERLEPRAVARFAAPRPEQPAAARARKAPAGGIQGLIERGRAAAAIGDLTAARLLYQRAAEAASGEAAMLLAETYDPHVLARLGAVGLTADPDTARRWYERAMQLGVRDAAGRIAALSRR